MVTTAIDAVLPADDFPSATQARVLDEFDRLAETDNAAVWQRILSPGFAHESNPRATIRSVRWHTHYTEMPRRDAVEG